MLRGLLQHRTASLAELSYRMPPRAQRKPFATSCKNARTHNPHSDVIDPILVVVLLPSTKLDGSGTEKEGEAEKKCCFNL